MTKLGHDSTNSKFTFQAQSKECYKCSFWTIGEDLVNGTTIPVNTTYPTSWKLFLSNGTEICKVSQIFYQAYHLRFVYIIGKWCKENLIKNRYFDLIYGIPKLNFPLKVVISRG